MIHAPRQERWVFSLWAGTIRSRIGGDSWGWENDDPDVLSLEAFHALRDAVWHEMGTQCFSLVIDHPTLGQIYRMDESTYLSRNVDPTPVLAGVPLYGVLPYPKKGISFHPVRPGDGDSDLVYTSALILPHFTRCQTLDYMPLLFLYEIARGGPDVFKHDVAWFHFAIHDQTWADELRSQGR